MAAPALAVDRDWEIQLLLFTNHIEFRGIQSGFGVALDLVLFAGPGGTTLAVDIEAFRNPKYALHLIRRKMWQAELERAKTAGNALLHHSE